MTDNHYSNAPVTSVTDPAMKCYDVTTLSANVTSTYSVPAGATIGFQANGAIYHPGPLFVYMSAANTALESAGSGATWFKVWQDVPVYTGGQLVFPSETRTSFTFTLPAALPAGSYLVRVEQIGLHVASTFGGAQFYIGCAQITVTGGGSGTPGPLVAFPGAYTGNEPGILIDIYNIPANYGGYVVPGPAVWPSGGGGSGTTTTKASTTTTKVGTTTTTTTKVTTTSTAAGATQTHYGQCGGSGYTGPTVCASPYTCTYSSQYYSQCL